MPKSFVLFSIATFATFTTQPFWLWSMIGSRVKISHCIQPSNLYCALGIWTITLPSTIFWVNILQLYDQNNINEWWAMVHGSSMAKRLPFILCQYQLNGDNNEPIYRGRCNRYNKKQVILRNWDTFAEGAAIRWAGRQAIFLQGNLWLVTTHWSTGCWWFVTLGNL